MTVRELIENLSKGDLDNEVRLFFAVDERQDEEFFIETIEASVGGFATTQIILEKE